MAQVQVRDVVAYVANLVPAAVEVRDVAAYVALRQPMIASLRYASMAVLRNDGRGVLIRRAAMMVARRSRKPDFSVSATARLFSVLQQDLGVTIQGNNATWSNPRPDTGHFNTLVDLTAGPGSRLVGSTTLRYDRYHLSEAFVGKSTQDYVVSADGTIHGLLEDLNSQFNLALTTDDVQDGPVTVGHTFTLQTTESSLWFLPGGSMTVGGYPSLDTAIAVADLSGFDAA